MDDNKKIARWLGVPEFDWAADIEADKAVAQWGKAGEPPLWILRGVVCSGMPSLHRVWSPDTDITLWHGEKGLLVEIRERGLMTPFITAVEDMRQMAGTFVGLTSTPAQLATALVEVIDNE